MEVRLLNQGAIKEFLKETGQFASVCMDSDAILNAERIALHCLNSGHLSTTRTSFFKFNISGISRVCSHQVVRHSQGVGLNQRSQRYVRENSPTYVTPGSIARVEKAIDIYQKHMESCWETYRALMELGITPDDSRFALPNACTTEINIGFSFEALVHFLHERLCTRASWEIRAVAFEMRRLVLEVEPRLKPFLVPKCVYLNGCREAKPCGYFSIDTKA